MSLITQETNETYKEKQLFQRVYNKKWQYWHLINLSYCDFCSQTSHFTVLLVLTYIKHFSLIKMYTFNGFYTFKF